MIRTLAVALLLPCLAAPALAQTQPSPGTAASQPGRPAAKPAAKKATPKAKSAANPSPTADNMPCQIGVIPAFGNQFVVQKIGMTVFGNDEAKVPIDSWGLDDLVVARVRAAAPGTGVRRIVYSNEAFASFSKPPFQLLRNSEDHLVSFVKQITANARCERYVVVTKFTAKFADTNQVLDGLGVFNHSSVIYSHTALFANIQVRVLDGNSYAIAKSPYARDFGAILAGAFTPEKPDPLAKLDDSSFPVPAAGAANNMMLRDRMRAFLASKLDKTLPAFLKAN